MKNKNKKNKKKVKDKKTKVKGETFSNIVPDNPPEGVYICVSCWFTSSY